MSVFDILGAAGAGLTKGLATSEQFKFQQKEKQRQEKQVEQTRIRQYELALRKQKFEEEQARGKEGAELRQIGFKSLMDLESKLATDQNWVAGMTPEQRALTIAHRDQLRRLVSNNAATRDDFMRLFSSRPDVYPIAQQGPGEAPAPNAPQGPQQFPQFPGQGQGLQTPEGYPTLERGDTSVPRLNRAPAPSLVPRQPQVPTMQGLLAQGFTPDFAAKTLADYQRGQASAATARDRGLGADIKQRQLPYSERQAIAELNRTREQGRAAGAQADALGGRLELDRKKFNEGVRQWGAEYAANRNDANRKLLLDQNAQRIAEFTARSADLLRQAQAGLAGVRVEQIRAELADLAKVDPTLKMFLSHLDDITDHTMLGDFVNPTKAGILADAMSGYGSQLGDVVRKFAGSAPKNPFAGTVSGSTVGPLPSMIPPGSLGPAQVTPQGIMSGGSQVPWLTPEMEAQFNRNRQQFEAGTFNPPLAGKGRRSAPPKTQPKPKTTKPAPAPKQSTKAAPKSEGKKTDYSKMSAAELAKRMADRAAKLEKGRK